MRKTWGLFNGYDPESCRHDPDKIAWQYASESGPSKTHTPEEIKDKSFSQRARHLENPVPVADPTLQHPGCVLNILKRHYARYTPDMVAAICGCTNEDFLEVAESLCANSGRERTTCIVYAVGWTQHSTGLQKIRAPW